jgi:hypothetical protein
MAGADIGGFADMTQVRPDVVMTCYYLGQLCN